MTAKSIIEGLRTRYWDRALDPDGLFLLKPQDALEYLDEAQLAGVSLAGVDGFFVSDLGYQPRQELSNDVDDFHVTQAEFYAETKELIARSDAPGIWFEVVFDLTEA